MMTVATKTPILLCAATKWEAEPLAARWALQPVSALRWEGIVRGADVALVKTGMGPANAREALAAVEAPRMVVSVGFAGALQPKMACGDLVLDVQGLDAEVPPTVREIALKQNVPFHFGRFAHSDEVVWQPEKKVALGRAERAVAVDMESRALRVSAERLGCPFLAARVVLDALHERLPAEMPSGESLSDLVPFALRHLPELPLMLKLGLRQRRAMTTLAAFLEELLPRL